MHVKVQLQDDDPTWPPGEQESNSLAAFLIAVDLAVGTGLTRQSMPELLDDPAQWPLHFGAGGSPPRPNDPEVHEAISALAQWAAAQRGANPLAPFQRFAFQDPSTPEGRTLKDEAWQQSGDLAMACWTLRQAIQAEPALHILDRKFAFLAYPAALPGGPKSNLDALRELALTARGQRLRLLLAT